MFMLTSWKKLDETSLAPKEALYSKLTGKGITVEDYGHAQTVWKEFNMESMKEYHNLYNHKGIKFEESARLEQYINVNKKLRTKAKQSWNNFEVDFFQTNEQFCIWQNTRKY